MGQALTAAILGVGSYAPEKRLTNQDFEKFLETTDEWITSRTGIKARHIAAPGENTSDLCLKAAQRALEDAGMQARELDLIIVGTVTPDYQMPSTGCMLQEKLGLAAASIPAVDVNAACSGFMYALSMAKAYVESGMAKRVLIVGAEVLSRVLDYQDRSTCILFGDGAGAAIIGPHTGGAKSHALREVTLGADGRGGPHIIIPGGGTAQPTTASTVADKLHCVRMEGREVFRFAVLKFVELIDDLLKRHKLSVDQVGKIVPHQANYRILEAACERLSTPMSLFVRNLDEYGNTSAASVPLAFDEAYRKGELPAGKPILLVGFGAGLTWGSAVIDW